MKDKQALIAYLETCLETGDWRAVRDAATELEIAEASTEAAKTSPPVFQFDLTINGGRDPETVARFVREEFKKLSPPTSRVVQHVTYNGPFGIESLPEQERAPELLRNAARAAMHFGVRHALGEDPTPEDDGSYDNAPAQRQFEIIVRELERATALLADAGAAVRFRDSALEALGLDDESDAADWIRGIGKARRCDGCSKPIGPREIDVLLGERHFHQGCFPSEQP